MALGSAGTELGDTGGDPGQQQLAHRSSLFLKKSSSVTVLIRINENNKSCIINMDLSLSLYTITFGLSQVCPAHLHARAFFILFLAFLVGKCFLKRIIK